MLRLEKLSVGLFCVKQVFHFKRTRIQASSNQKIFKGDKIVKLQLILISRIHHEASSLPSSSGYSLASPARKKSGTRWFFNFYVLFMSSMILPSSPSRQ